MVKASFLAFVMFFVSHANHVMYGAFLPCHTPLMIFGGMILLQKLACQLSGHSHCILYYGLNYISL